MNILVTGATGRLGRVACRVLAEAGHRVVGTDNDYRAGLGVPLELANLLEPLPVYRLVENVEAVVHLANHPGYPGRGAQRIFNENVSMNMNVLEACAQVGVRRLVFASTVQVIASEDGYVPDPPHHVPYLPLDEQVPANPTNPYALSKYITEQMMMNYSRLWGMSTVALRLPALRPEPPDRPLRNRRPPSRARIARGFSYLTFTDTAELIDAILSAPLEGYRQYMPASPRPDVNHPVADLIERFYPDVPLKRPADQLDRLVDVSRITEDTGWEPKDRVDNGKAPAGTADR